MNRTTGIRRSALAVALSAAMVLMAGCAGGGKEPVGLATASAKPTPTPTVTAKPKTAGPTDLSDVKLGIEFTAIPKVENQVAADAIETQMRFEVEFWKALTTNKVPPGPWGIASDDSLAWVKAQVDGNAAGGWTLSGTVTKSIELVSADDANTVLDVCSSWRKVLFVDSDSKSMTAVEAGIDETSKNRIGMIRTPAGGWMVDTHERTGTC